MNATLSIDNREFTRAVQDFARLKGKTDEQVINKAMKYWVPFTSNKLKPATPAEIRADLMKQARAGSGQGIKSKWGINTVAAAIVASRMKKNGATAENAGSFLARVNNLIAARTRGSGYLKAGMIPDMRKFNVPLRGTKRMTAKGYSGGHAAKQVGGFTEALSRNAREGAYKKYPNAYHQALGEVAKQFRKFIDQDYNALATKTGF